MTDDILKLIKYRFSQAEETITAAKELIRNAEKFVDEAHRVLDKMQSQG